MLPALRRETKVVERGEIGARHKGDSGTRLEKVTKMSLLSLQIRLKDNEKDNMYGNDVS